MHRGANVEVSWPVVLELLKRLGLKPRTVRDLGGEVRVRTRDQDRFVPAGESRVRAALEYLADERIAFVLRHQEMNPLGFSLNPGKLVHIRWYIYDLERSLYPAFTTFEDSVGDDAVEAMREYFQGFERALRGDSMGASLPRDWGQFGYSSKLVVVQPTPSELEILEPHIGFARWCLRQAQNKAVEQSDIAMRSSHYNRGQTRGALERALQEHQFDLRIIRESRAVDPHTLEAPDRASDIIRVPLFTVIQTLRRSNRLPRDFVLAKFGPPWTAHILVANPTKAPGNNQHEPLSALLVSGCDPFKGHTLQILRKLGFREKGLEEQVIEIDNIEHELAKERSERIAVVLEAHQAIPALGRYPFQPVATIVDPGALLVRVTAFQGKLSQGQRGLSRTLGSPLRDLHKGNHALRGLPEHAARDLRIYKIPEENVRRLAEARLFKPQSVDALIRDGSAPGE